MAASQFSMALASGVSRGIGVASLCPDDGIAGLGETVFVPGSPVATIATSARSRAGPVDRREWVAARSRIFQGLSASRPSGGLAAFVQEFLRDLDVMLRERERGVRDLADRDVVRVGRVQPR